MEKQGIVSNIQKFSVHDGPGIRSVIFLKGCPLRCQWCANPENIAMQPQLMVHQTRCIGCGLCVKACKQGAVYLRDGILGLHRELCRNCGDCAKVCPSQARVYKGDLMTPEDARCVIDRDLPFYRNSGGGVTFSGGEPLLYPVFITEIAREYKVQGLHTAVETCGCVPWECFELISPWIDLFLYDVKFIDSAKHKQHCAMGNELILDNLRKLCQRSHVVIRIPIIPGINDTKQDLEAMAEFLSGLGDGIESVHCLPYHNMGISKYEALGIPYPLPAVELPSAAHMEAIRQLFAANGLKVQTGG